MPLCLYLCKLYSVRVYQVIKDIICQRKNYIQQSLRKKLIQGSNMSKMLYKSPRTNKSNNGNKGFIKNKEFELDYIIVEESQVDSMLKEGWAKHPLEAMKEEVQSLKALPSREKLEEKARKEDIVFAHNISDQKLYDRIMEKLNKDK